MKTSHIELLYFTLIIRQGERVVEKVEYRDAPDSLWSMVDRHLIALPKLSLR